MEAERRESPTVRGLTCDLGMGGLTGILLAWMKGERRGQLRQRPREGNGMALCEGHTGLSSVLDSACSSLPQHLSTYSPPAWHGLPPESPWLDASHCPAHVPSSEKPSLTTRYSTSLSHLTLWTSFGVFFFFSLSAHHTLKRCLCICRFIACLSLKCKFHKSRGLVCSLPCLCCLST